MPSVSLNTDSPETDAMPQPVPETSGEFVFPSLPVRRDTVSFPFVAFPALEPANDPPAWGETFAAPPASDRREYVTSDFVPVACVSLFNSGSGASPADAATPANTDAGDTEPPSDRLSGNAPLAMAC